MVSVNVEGMSCGHCVKAVTRAIQDNDAQATVDVDLEKKQVTVDSSSLTVQQIESAISAAGYDVIKTA